MQEEQLLKNRFTELAGRAYKQGSYAFTGFLNPMEITILYQSMKEMGCTFFSLYGGYADSERQAARFGSEELFGYQQDFPISCILARPLSKKFADDFSHRDYLGALMNLGIERNTIGDILLTDEAAYIFCMKNIENYIIENLDKVKHTSIKCCKSEKHPEEIQVKFEEIEETASSERIDAVLARICRISRNQSVELFREKKVFVNSILCENNDSYLKKGDVLSVRGYGKVVYEGVIYRTKKDKLRFKIKKYL